MARKQTANAFETTLTNNVSGTDTTFNVETTSGAPGSPCFLVINPENPNKREYVLFDGSFTGTSFSTTTLDNRHLAGSAASSGLTHDAGDVVRASTVSQLFQTLWNDIEQLEIGKAADPHGNEAHSEAYAVNPHGNEAHDPNFALEDHEHNGGGSEIQFVMMMNEPYDGAADLFATTSWATYRDGIIELPPGWTTMDVYIEFLISQINMMGADNVSGVLRQRFLINGSTTHDASRTIVDSLYNDGEGTLGHIPMPGPSGLIPNVDANLTWEWQMEKAGGANIHSDARICRAMLVRTS